MKLGHILKQLRKEKNITQDALAKILFIKRSTIAGYESGRRQPDFLTLIKIANYFEVNMDFLAGRTNIKSSFNIINPIIENDTELSSFVNEFLQKDNIRNLCKSILKLSPNQINKLMIISKILKSSSDFS